MKLRLPIFARGSAADVFEQKGAHYHKQKIVHRDRMKPERSVKKSEPELKDRIREVKCDRAMQRYLYAQMRVGRQSVYKAVILLYFFYEFYKVWNTDTPHAKSIKGNHIRRV